ncbi:ATP-binding protein [Streptomyces sp. NPDC059506]|uniref:ATP-binding protein n=1 Tax=Streptomyces TaxID=1883 RepID=UPI000CB70377|nr:ATP-binding protein [Streptomyces sp. SCUT-3]PLW74122.1 hypothetical protein C0036_03655 [Streptomyces sp. DJ]QMV22179.1 ATP-binding protein [Streptomyces sp. SCUT-3]
MTPYQHTFPGTPEEIARARRWTRDVLRGLPCAEDAALIVTELGTNALVHTASGNQAGTFHVSLTLVNQAVMIAVTDSGGAKTTPRVEHPSDDTPRGRGLGIIDALAERVEIHGDHRGHTVTVHLGRTSVPQAVPC